MGTNFWRRKKVNMKMKKITLATGAIVEIPYEFQYAKCWGYPANDIIWAITKNSKPIAKNFRKGDK